MKKLILALTITLIPTLSFASMEKAKEMTTFAVQKSHSGECAALNKHVNTGGRDGLKAGDYSLEEEKKQIDAACKQIKEYHPKGTVKFVDVKHLKRTNPQDKKEYDIYIVMVDREGKKGVFAWVMNGDNFILMDVD